MIQKCVGCIKRRGNFFFFTSKWIVNSPRIRKPLKHYFNVEFSFLAYETPPPTPPPNFERPYLSISLIFSIIWSVLDMPIGRVHLILEHHHDSWMPLKFNTFETQFECKFLIFNFRGPYVLRFSLIFNDSKCIRYAKKRVKLFLWKPLWFVDPLGIQKPLKHYFNVDFSFAA